VRFANRAARNCSTIRLSRNRLDAARVYLKFSLETPFVADCYIADTPTTITLGYFWRDYLRRRWANPDTVYGEASL
jgi:hypothetical protein